MESSGALWSNGRFVPAPCSVPATYSYPVSAVTARCALTECGSVPCKVFTNHACGSPDRLRFARLRLLPMIQPQSLAPTLALRHPPATDGGETILFPGSTQRTGQPAMKRDLAL